MTNKTGPGLSVVRALSLVISVITVLGAERSLLATTFVLAGVEELYEAADVVLVGTVSSIESVGDDRTVRTNIEVAVERTLKRDVANPVTLVEASGDNGHLSRWQFGTARFYVGEKILVFARLNSHGELRPLFLGMGKFRVVRDRRGLEYAVRNLDEGLVLDPRKRRVLRATSTTFRLADLWQRLQALEPADRRRKAPLSSRRASGALRRPRFAFSGPPAVRWFAFDEGGRVGFRIDETGDLSIGPHNSRAAAEQAVEAWSQVPCSSVRAMIEGEGEPSSFSTCNGVSQISFNDPFDDIDDPVDCVGVLGVGGVCGSNEQRAFAGSSYAVITEGDVVIANGFGSCPFWNIPNLAEVLTHEVGHSLGLAHSSEDPNEPDLLKRDAAMYYQAHFDFRGAYLGAEDRAAVCALYPAQEGSEFVTERGAFVATDVGGSLRQRLLITGLFQPSDSALSPDSQPFFISARTGREFLFQISVLPDQWLRNVNGNRWRYRERRSEAVTVVDLVRTPEGSYKVTVVNRRNSEFVSVEDAFTFSMTLGEASATRAVRLRQGMRALVFP